jgi:Family of unknown function (DUF6325)
MEMEDIGPVDYAIVAFPGSRFTGMIAPALAELADAGTIRIIDVAFISKSEDGEISGFDLDEIEAEVSAGFERAGVAGETLFNEDDVMAAAAELEPGSSAAMIVWENVWARRIADAVRAADGMLVDFGRIPHEIVKAAREFEGVAT